jgi:hypothetical protein
LVAAKVETVKVASKSELRQEVANYISQGYVVSSQNDEMATLEFRVRYNMPLLILLLLLCIIPGLVYIFMVGAKAGRQVVIVVDSESETATPPPEDEPGTATSPGTA